MSDSLYGQEQEEFREPLAAKAPECLSEKLETSETLEEGVPSLIKPDTGGEGTVSTSRGLLTIRASQNEEEELVAAVGIEEGAPNPISSDTRSEGTSRTETEHAEMENGGADTPGGSGAVRRDAAALMEGQRNDPTLARAWKDAKEGKGDGDAYYAAPHTAATEGGEVECNTSLCRHMKDWFDATVGSQADPCKERNTFVCHASVTFPSFDSHAATHVAGTGEHEIEDASIRQKRGTGAADRQELMKSCLDYAWNPAEGVQDVLSFLQHFNLDLRRMEDDPTEDPLRRMMQLSFDYGVDTPVSFSRKYDVIAEAPAPFTMQITLNPEVAEFVNTLHSLEEDDIDDFYQFFLAHYALVDDPNVTQQLIDADEEIAEFVNETAAAAGRRLRMTVANLSDAAGIPTDRWEQLFARFGLSKHGVGVHVVADQPALLLVAFLSRPTEMLAMRRALAWNVLRYLVGPKADVVAALNWTRTVEDVTDRLGVMPTPESKCQRLVETLSGVPHGVLKFFEGENVVPAATISDATGLMAELQEAVASIFKGSATNDSSPVVAATHSPPSATAGATSQAALFSDFTRSTNGTMLQGPTGAGGSFPRRLLRRLRAWHALPPLAQALLPAMTSVVSVDSPAAFFRPPFYVPRAPPVYNLAALGQVVAQALAHALLERRLTDPAVGEHWRSFWESVDAADDHSIYCLHTAHNKNYTWLQRRLNESELDDGPRLRKALGSRIAFLAFQRTRRTNARLGSSRRLPTAVVPGVHLSRKQLFFVMHCALGCAMAGERARALPRTPDDQQQRCMVVYETRRHLDDRHCGGRLASGSTPNDCRYI
ncbi:hypothetical protein HPB50_016332 [Hyalomma asiaticum]|uniref:Uncharacterized protein n=1 Tax=Hyalomma asiaticum TaxID=266040 RepID=A0ACB7SQZ2_HYAAI|nr:hypothetical protein HPB50_016332 [Hyalomma asiaticum]